MEYLQGNSFDLKIMWKCLRMMMFRENVYVCNDNDE